MLRRKHGSVEMQQKLNIQRFKLEQLQLKIAERIQHSMLECRKCLEIGDEGGFRAASHGCVLAKHAARSINELREMSLEMLNLVEMGEILHDVVETGGDLVKMQGKLGLDPTTLESSLIKIKSSMTHMEGIADALSSTIEGGISNPKALSANQEVLRKELLAEMEGRKTKSGVVNEHQNKELQSVSTF